MQRTNIIHHTQLQNVQSKQITDYKAGQILYGKVMKIYPNQTAEVQIGNQRLIASLDAPLESGERYWLQVQPGDGKIHLKVLAQGAAFNKEGLSGAAEQLLNHLVVPVGKESVELAKFLMKNQLPITNESFLKALEWMKSSGNHQESLQIIKTMHSRSLPFVQDVFLALHSIEQEEPFHSILSRLNTQITGSNIGSEAAQKAQAVIEKIIAPSKDFQVTEGLNRLVTSWLENESSSKNQKAAYSLLQKTALVTDSLSEPDFFERIVTEFQSGKTLLPQAVREGFQLISEYRQARLSGDSQLETDTLISFQLLLKNGNFSDISQTDKSIPLTGLEQTVRDEVTLKQIKQLFHTWLDKMGGNAASNILQIFSKSSGGGEIDISAGVNKLSSLMLETLDGKSPVEIPGDELDLIKQMILSNTKYEPALQGSTAKLLREIPGLLGLNLEHVLSEAQIQPESSEFDTLKPLLLRMLQDNLPMSLKETAEQLLNRITAQQILSQDTGPIQNIFMQIPLVLANHHSDMTIQWTGRKKSDGSIDPDYCRVLFYLELEHLKLTVVDMVVQNRVMKIKIINEDNIEIEHLAKPFIASLKQNLEQMDYKLSAITFETTKEHGKENNKVSKVSIPTFDNKIYSGVDFRI
jgi:hypothetical protein